LNRARNPPLSAIILVKFVIARSPDSKKQENKLMQQNTKNE